MWQIKLTLHFLADEGNMLDCACLAGVAALRHYRRPDVEVVGEDVIIVSPFPCLSFFSRCAKLIELS